MMDEIKTAPYRKKHLGSERAVRCHVAVDVAATMRANLDCGAMDQLWGDRLDAGSVERVRACLKTVLRGPIERAQDGAILVALHPFEIVALHKAAMASMAEIDCDRRGAEERGWSPGLIRSLYEADNAIRSAKGA